MAHLPEEQIFRTHIEEGPFQSGVVRGRWRLIAIDWPFVLIAISAAHRPVSPEEYVLRFNLQNYPQWGPTAQPWDLELNTSLQEGKRPHGKSRVPMAFRTNWKNGTALYLPCDREAIQGHDAWKHQHPSMIWSSKDNITKYLRIVYDLLNSSDYTGTRSA